jgi:hypothetical protein
VVDSGPLLCPEDEKARRESENGVAQLDYIAHLLILDRREDYIAALRAADASVDDVDGGIPDLSMMESFVTDVVTRQLASAIDRLSGGAGSTTP